MKKRVGLLCSLVCVASLSSCAPTVTGPGGERYQPQVRPGSSAYFHETVKLADLTAQTPDDASVFLPGCSLAAVSAKDVRALGVERATAICSDTVSRQVRGFGGVMLVMGVIAAIMLVPFIKLFVYVFSHIDG